MYALGSLFGCRVLGVTAAAMSASVLRLANPAISLELLWCRWMSRGREGGVFLFVVDVDVVLGVSGGEGAAKIFALK